MQGPGSSLDFVLGASSLADLTDRLEFMDVLAQDDADLSVQVQNTKQVLAAKKAKLADLQAKEQKILERVQSHLQEINDDQAKASAILEQIAAKKAEAEKYAKKLSSERQQWLQSQFSGGGQMHSSISMPPGWAGTFKVCPVDQPRAYGDGFGAPRYAGGYHLHAGVDILAPEGTPIRATFDGTASKTPNGLGGNAVIVSGGVGYTYNAHLSAYSDHSSGPVSAGDIIGYVGDTGDAQGGPPHDHFEFHPYNMPSSWPRSYYGYSVIGSALNPYPLIVDACG
jgi:murein DD-endopeptidase MepM/ murein hydrolase activator NlpD